MRTSIGARLAKLKVGRQLREFVSSLVSDALIECAKEIDEKGRMAADRKEKDCQLQECELSLRQLGKFDGLTESAQLLRLRAYHVRIDAGIENTLERGE